MKSKHIKSNHLPRWINHEVKKAMYKRDRFHKLKDWYNYKTMRNKVLHLIRKNKKDYYNNAIKAGTNTKDLWTNLRKIQNNDNLDNESIQLPSKMVFIGEHIQGTKNILNSFNDHFINIASIVNKSKFNEYNFPFLRSHLHHILKDQVFDIDFITPLMVRQFLNKLETNKASGIDGISATILKYCGGHIVLPITSIINNSIAKGIFPTALKEAYVLPLHKGAEKEDPNNYRPISILPTISNIFECHLSNHY